MKLLHNWMILACRKDALCYSYKLLAAQIELERTVPAFVQPHVCKHAVSLFGILLACFIFLEWCAPQAPAGVVSASPPMEVYT